MGVSCERTEQWDCIVGRNAKKFGATGILKWWVGSRINE
jgi:hypothetical protein